MWRDAGELLRATGRYAVERQSVPWRRLLCFVILGGALYGLVMGALGGRWQGALYSAAKVPILLTCSTCVCLPNFWVVLALLGLRDDFAAAVRGILAAQGTLALCLASLAPVTALFYWSGLDYPGALLWSAGCFGLASLAAQRTLRRHYRPLIARRPRHVRALAAWLALYVFVGIKLGWVLRPFVGDPQLPPAFLRAEQWQDDPYTNLFWTAVGLAASAVRALRGG
jgi:hypothetical protein